MKAKLAIVLVLAFAVGAAIWLGHRRSMVLAGGAASKQQSGGRSAVLPVKFLPFNSVRMVTVARKSALNPALFNPGLNAWDDIHLIVNDRADMGQRLAAISRLPAKLTAADWQVLKKFLLKPDSLDKEQLGQVLKNNLMDQFCLMNPLPGGLGTLLAQVYQNQEQDEVVRDYALQHLATVDAGLASGGGRVTVQEEQTDEKVLWSAINETGDSIAGTALLGLVRVSQQPNAKVNEKKLTATALELANDNLAGELTQITAYQVCAQLNLQDALPTIEAAAQNSQTIPQQISAIGALGQLGGTNDIPLLQSLLQGSNQRLQLPAQTALQRIETRTPASSQSS